MRVIAGTLGGRRLVAPPGSETRPTSDRVREALFMALEPLADLSVADLFAGSGALGIEALSRGAAHVDFVERHGPALAAMRMNLAQLELESRAKIWTLDLRIGMKPLAAALAGADLILLDPPYRQGLAEAALAELGAMALRSAVRVVVEHHAKEPMPEHVGILALARTRRYGETAVTTYRHAEPRD